MEFFAAPFAAFLALGATGMALFGLSAAASLGLAYLEKGLFSFLALVAMVASASYFGGLNPFAFAASHPLLLVGSFLGYFAVGAVWSMTRFWFYSKSLARSFSDFKAQFLSKLGAKDLSELPPPDLATFKEAATKRMSKLSRSGQYPATPASHKADIMFWMGWWPVSIARFVLDEPLRRLMEAIYRRMLRVYVGIAREQSAEYVAAMGGSTS